MCEKLFTGLFLMASVHLGLVGSFNSHCSVDVLRRARAAGLRSAFTAHPHVRLHAVLCVDVSLTESQKLLETETRLESGRFSEVGLVEKGCTL